MGHIEITTSVGTRRIRDDELSGVIRIDLAGEGHTVTLPEGMDVSRADSIASETRASRRTHD